MVFLKYILVIGIAYVLFKRFSKPPGKINEKPKGKTPESEVKGGDYIDYEEVNE